LLGRLKIVFHSINNKTTGISSSVSSGIYYISCNHKPIIVKLKDFIYNKETKVSNLAGVLYVIIVTLISAAGVYLSTLF